MGVRIGIDVGGTFTKAVLLEGGRLLGKWSVPTAHGAPRGVAEGVVEVLRRALREAGGREVSLVCHSTTQATNALLEGDVAPVGVVAMAPARARRLVEARTRLEEFSLSQGRRLTLHHRFLDTTEGVDGPGAAKAVEDLASRGARALVATELFGVEHEANEERVVRAAADRGIPCTAGHEISRLYGLEVRTLTAVLNAGLLPKMEETAAFVEKSVQDEGVRAPLMVLRGDGGMVSVSGMKERPILTALSGPAASLAGGLYWARVTDGVFMDVGGTSTHITALRGGSPAFKYVKIGRFPTYIPSLDVRVVDIGGGSMVRLRGRRVQEVGPRSAHIAGLGYSCFAPPEALRDATPARIAPVEGDPSDYAVLRSPGGGTWAITATCAANALGIPGPGDHARGDPASARLAVELLARSLGRKPGRVAREILQNAAWKAAQAIRPLLRESGLPRRGLALAAGGGGAAVLASPTAEQLGAEPVIVPDADVISAIGVSMAPVCEVVEHTLAEDSDPAEIERLRRGAVEGAVRSGARPETVRVVVEHEPARSTVRITALGLAAPGQGDTVTEEEARKRAARTLGLAPERMDCVAVVGPFRVFRGRDGRFREGAVGVVDSLGITRLALRSATLIQGTESEVLRSVEEGLLAASPRVFVVSERGVLDLSIFQGRERLLEALRRELESAPAGRVAVALSRTGWR